ncbi:hypothetical protein C0J52_20686 [Blattella germanica]|nr:hypothetical protein C0J52_20686 [Blattella germanica]
MDYGTLEVEPNRNADAYRNYQPTHLPSHVEKHIDFIEICEGSLWYFIEPDAAPDAEKCLTCIDCETGVTDGKFLEDKQKVIVCEDSGAVQVLGLSESAEEHSFHFESLNSVCEHDDSVLSVSVFPDKKYAVTGGADMNIKVWSIESLMSEHTYRPAHLHQVTCVCAQPEGGNSIFASGSYDGSALIWDTRNPKPAEVAWFDRTKQPTSLSWHTTKNNILAIGTSVGEVSILDTRQLKIPLGKTACFNRPLHRLRFANHK